MATTPTSEAYNELQVAYDYFNKTLFDGGLPPCLITFQREKRMMGYFSPTRFARRRDSATTDEIALNPQHFDRRSDKETLSTLAHEMVHLWQHHNGKPGRRGYHNVEWGTKMESIGLMPSHTAAPGGKRVGERMSHYIVENGPFDIAATALLATGVEISWADKPPERKPPAPPKPPKPAPHPPIVDDDPEGDDEGCGPPDAGGVTIDDDGNTIVEIGGGVSYVESPVPQNASNRVKFRCPNCGAQAWGKPTLRLLCGNADCAEAPFDAVG